MVRTNTLGIHPSDVILRTAIIAGLDEIRENPWLLDFVFSALTHDDLTASDVEYGQAELGRAKEWFLENDIPVQMSYRTDSFSSPIISVSLEDSSEGPTTLGDVHYEPTEQVDAKDIVINPDPILGPFTPAKYDRVTGTITLPAGLTTDQLFEGMLLFDSKANQSYQITEVIDGTSFKIAAGTKANFTKAYVAPKEAFYIAHLESLQEKETYRIQINVPGNATQLLYLYAVVKFAYFRGKQKYLEARGFERSSLSNGGVGAFKHTDVEVVFTRSFSLTGYVRQYWPKDIQPMIQGLTVDVAAIDEDKNPFEFMES